MNHQDAAVCAGETPVKVALRIIRFEFREGELIGRSHEKALRCPRPMGWPPARPAWSAPAHAPESPEEIHRLLASVQENLTLGTPGTSRSFRDYNYAVLWTSPCV